MSFILEPFVRKNIALDELLIGELLDFSTLTCPALAKSWFRFADWAYIWGRQLLARSIPYVVNVFKFFFFKNFLLSIRLSSLDMGQQVRAILPAVCSFDFIFKKQNFIKRDYKILTTE